MVWARRGRAGIEEDLRSSWGTVIEAILEGADSSYQELVQAPAAGIGVGNARERRAGAASVSPREAVIRFRRSAVALALGSDPGQKAQNDARSCAEALMDLSDGGYEPALVSVLRADPADDGATWTVACYEIGDLSPTSLRDFPEAVPAVAYLAGCETPSHVAGELIVTNGAGVRWTALTRTGPDVLYQPFGQSTATADSPALLTAVRHRWEDQLLAWAAGPDRGLEPPAPAEPATAGPAAPAPAAAAPAGSDGTAVGIALGQILESVRRIEQRLPADEVVHSPAPASVTAMQTRADEVASLRAEMAELSRHNEALQRQLEEIRAELRHLRARPVEVEPVVTGSVVTGPVVTGRVRHGSAGQPRLSALIARWFVWRAAEWFDMRGEPVPSSRPGREPIALVEAEQRRSH